MKIDADAQKVIDLLKATGRPKFDTIAAGGGTRSLPSGAQSDVTRSDRRRRNARRRRARSARRNPAATFTAASVRRRRNVPCLIYIHGGGYVIGDRDTHDHVCRKLANESRGAVMSIDYRLAPEHKFPTGVEDCVAAAKWIAANAHEFGIDAAKLAVGGDSAGGNLSAVLCLHSKNGDGPNYCYQLLLYPGTNMDNDYVGGPGANSELPLTNSLTDWFRGHYIRSEADRTDWRASPSHAPSHEGLPRAFVLTAYHDPIGDEGRAYAKKLSEAGVQVWHVDMSDQVHGFLTMGRVIRAADATLEMCGAALRYAYATA